MNENETIEVKKMSKYQMLKVKVQTKLVHVLTVSMMLGTMAVSNASANSSINFTGVTDTIDAIIPLFTSLQNLVIAIVPYILTLAIVGGLVVLIKGLFDKGLKF